MTGPRIPNAPRSRVSSLNPLPGWAGIANRARRTDQLLANESFCTGADVKVEVRSEPITRVRWRDSRSLPTLLRLMARRGDLYENQVTGERAVVLRGDVDGSGLPGLVHLIVQPHGAVVGEHVHPAMDERFRVVSGQLQTRIGERDGRLGPGEEALASAGVRHDWWNAGEVPASVIIELSPAAGLARFEAMIATLFGLANAGHANAEGLPSPLQLALTASEFSDVIQMTRPPRMIQRVAFRVLGAVARRRGLRPTYSEMLRPYATVEPDPTVLAAAGLS